MASSSSSTSPKAPTLPRASPLQHITFALDQVLSVQIHGVLPVQLDAGFDPAVCLAPEWPSAEGGARSEAWIRNDREWKTKQRVYAEVKGWDEHEQEREVGGEDGYALLCYRHLLHRLEKGQFYDDYSGMLFCDYTLRRFILIDLHSTASSSTSDLTALTKQRASRLFGMLHYLGNPPPDFVASTWLPHDSDAPLPPSFLANLSTINELETPTLPSSPPQDQFFITAETYTPNLTWDDLANIDVLVQARIGEEAEEFGGAERRGLVLQKGCERCRKVVESMKKCGACLGAEYCSALCQKALWSVHKVACKRYKQMKEAETKVEPHDCAKHGPGGHHHHH